MPPAFNRTWALEPWRLLEASIYLRPTLYQNTGLKPALSFTSYDTGLTILMFILLSSSTKIDSGVKLAHLVVHRMF